MFIDYSINKSQKTFGKQGYIECTKYCNVDDKAKDPIIEYCEDN